MRRRAFHTRVSSEMQICRACFRPPRAAATPARPPVSAARARATADAPRPWGALARMVYSLVCAALVLRAAALHRVAADVLCPGVISVVRFKNTRHVMQGPTCF